MNTLHSAPGDPPRSASGEGHVNDVLARRRKFSWKSFGGDGFLISVAVHILLVLIGLFYVVSRYAAPGKRAETEVFSSGSGGGTGGEKVKFSERKLVKLNTPPVKMRPRLVVKGVGAVSLPETPPAPKSPFANTASGVALAGGLSSGAGGGAGGGRGPGTGIGIGGGKNFSGRFFGTKVNAKKVAVYLDASGSMRPYLARVEAEAKACFPEADVYRYNGIHVYIEDGAVTWGTAGRTAYKRKVPADGAENDPALFGDLGKKILRRHTEKFARGSVGAWFDHLVAEQYDALIIFSDFKDGFRQYDKAGTLIFDDRPRSNKDSRASRDKAWETRWLRLLSKAGAGGAPKVYLYSLSADPQSVWQRCVEASGGAVTMVPWMKRANGQPPEDGGLEKVADAVNSGKGRSDTPVKPR